MNTGIVFHPDYLLHEQGPDHPERRERIAYTLDILDEEEIWEESGVERIEPRIASEDEILNVHSSLYFDYLKGIDRKGAVLDINTYGPPGFLKGALLSAGGAVCGAEAVLSGEMRNSFALIRPPGHHAGRSYGGGFCYLNNVAIMVKAVQKAGLKRVMIIDWDAHHGNGTEDIFYEDPDVLYTSIHQSHLFPGTGPLNSAGSGEGKGFNINMPVPPGSPGDVYRYLTEEIIFPAAEEFRPDFIAISAGQDNHFTDPVTSLALTARDYADLMSAAVSLSERLCGGRLSAVLEGGYGVEGALPYVNLAIIASLAGLDLSGIREPESYEPLLKYEINNQALAITKKMVSKLRKIHSDYWSFL